MATQKTEIPLNMDMEIKPEEKKAEVAILMTTDLMELKITSKFIENDLSISKLEERALNLVKNEDSIKDMATLLADIDTAEEKAIETHKEVKKPFADAVKACDDGKKLILENIERIREMVQPDYDKLLADIDARKRAAARKEAEDIAIRKGIAETLASLVKKITQAATLKELSDVERLINLEKSPSRTKKYGEFHQEAIKKYDEVLLSKVKIQKLKLKQLASLHGALEEAESDREGDDIVKLKDSIDEVSQEIRENRSSVEDQILNQEFFPVIEAEEVFPEIRTKRTDISFVLEDEEVALKKVRHLLTIELDNKAIRKVVAVMKKAGVFEGKDEVIVDGIKYIVTRQREAL